jgi:hypothetical protein
MDENGSSERGRSTGAQGVKDVKRGNLPKIDNWTTIINLRLLNY